MDQSISTNHYHNLLKTDGKKKKSDLVREVLVARRYGLKTLYYSNIRSTDQSDGLGGLGGLEEEAESPGCSGGGCEV
jgi:hypothetical protein